MEENKKGEILLYQTADGQSKIEVALVKDTVWLTLEQMAELFQRNKSTISRHIKNIFESGELQADSTVANFATVQTEGQRTVQWENSEIPNFLPNQFNVTNRPFRGI